MVKDEDGQPQRSTVFDKIGFEAIRNVTSTFYTLAKDDLMICHFFIDKDIDALVEKQSLFTAAMLGSKEHVYAGQGLKKAHNPLSIRTPHYMRRQRLLEQAMKDHGLPDELCKAWLNAEDRFQSKVMATQTTP